VPLILYRTRVQQGECALLRERGDAGSLKGPGTAEDKQVVDHGEEITAAIAPEERGIMHRIQPQIDAARW
jgi:hypothetical protein